MNMSENVGRLGDVSSHGSSEMCREVMFYLMIFFFHDQKRDMTSSVTRSERFE